VRGGSVWGRDVRIRLGQVCVLYLLMFTGSPAELTELPIRRGVCGIPDVIVVTSDSMTQAVHVTSTPSLAIFRQHLKSFLLNSLSLIRTFIADSRIAYYCVFIFVDLAIILTLFRPH